MSVAAKPQQANRCSPRAYLIPPGIILILVSHAFNRSQIPSTRHAAAAAALGSEIKGRLRQILLPACRHYIQYILLAAGAQSDTARSRETKRIAGQAEVVPCC